MASGASGAGIPGGAPTGLEPFKTAFKLGVSGRGFRRTRRTERGRPSELTGGPPGGGCRGRSRPAAVAGEMMGRRRARIQPMQRLRYAGGASREPRIALRRPAWAGPACYGRKSRTVSRRAVPRIAEGAHAAQQDGRRTGRRRPGRPGRRRTRVPSMRHAAAGGPSAGPRGRLLFTIARKAPISLRAVSPSRNRG